jgi:hypothetical protein
LSRRRLKATALVAIGGALAVGGVAAAGGGGNIREELSGYQEVPALSTTGHGSLRARINNGSIEYTLRYGDLEGTVTQSHIHLGNEGVNGGISVFLCSNLPSPPPGTPACPLTNPAEVSGTLEPEDVIGPTGQGIDPGEFDELLRAIRAGATYANVHSTKYPGGEIRHQIERGNNE